MSYCLPKETGYEIIKDVYDKKYDEFYYKINSNKLGLFFSEITEKENIKFIDETMSLLCDYGIDLTFFFRKLADINKIIISELDHIKFNSIENLKSQLTTEEKIEFLCSPIIEKIKTYSLPFELRIKNNKLSLNPKALSNLERFLNGNIH